MADWFASGRVIDGILVLMLFEAIALTVFHQRRRHGIPPGELLLTLGAGAALLMALRAALTGAPWTGIAAWLAVGLGMHVGQLSARWGYTRRSTVKD